MNVPSFDLEVMPDDAVDMSNKFYGVNDFLLSVQRRMFAVTEWVAGTSHRI